MKAMKEDFVQKGDVRLTVFWNKYEGGLYGKGLYLGQYFN